MIHLNSRKTTALRRIHFAPDTEAILQESMIISIAHGDCLSCKFPRSHTLEDEAEAHTEYLSRQQIILHKGTHCEVTGINGREEANSQRIPSQ